MNKLNWITRGGFETHDKTTGEKLAVPIYHNQPPYNVGSTQAKKRRAMEKKQKRAERRLARRVAA